MSKLSASLKIFSKKKQTKKTKTQETTRKLVTIVQYLLSLIFSFVGQNTSLLKLSYDN